MYMSKFSSIQFGGCCGGCFHRRCYHVKSHSASAIRLLDSFLYNASIAILNSQSFSQLFVPSNWFIADHSSPTFSMKPLFQQSLDVLDISRPPQSSQNAQASTTSQLSGLNVLPPELRIMIWHLAIPEPRVIRIYSKRMLDGSCRVLDGGTRFVPTILQICHESREVA